MKTRFALGAILALGLALMTTATIRAAEHEAAASGAQADAIAVLQATDGNSVSGIIKFTKVDDGVHVQAHIEGLTPGQHGFHIHQFGDLSAPDGTSAGGHFDPAGHEHGAPDADTRHIGDLGNLEADEQGHAHYDRVDAHLELSGDNSIIGRGIVVHADADDLKTQPTGNAGGRVAVGVIGIAQQK
jgi:Cu-Zn family superoxide dismutase